MKHLAWGLGCLLAAALPVSAQERGYAFSGTTLRAGPAADYPQVAQLGRADELLVHGCVVQWSWCDVEAGGKRGWMPSGLIDFEITQSADILLPTLQSVKFVLDDYWDTHYAGQKWARNREPWRAHAPPVVVAVPYRIAERIAPVAPDVPEPPTGVTTAPPQAAWVAPGDRMNSQLPPPDAVNPRYNKKMREAGCAAPKEWWLLPPEYLKSGLPETHEPGYSCRS